MNLVNGKQYIGSSVNVEKRWMGHRSALRNNKHHATYLQHAWSKYGEEFFSFELLWKCEPDECLYEEQLALNNIKCEYNVCTVAGSPGHRKLSNETKKKIGDSNRGRVASDETKKKMSMARKSRKLSAETIEKIAAKHRGMKRSDESRAKMSAAAKTKKKPLKIKRNPVSEKTRQKQRENSKLKKAVKATREDGLVIYFNSIGDATRSGFIKSCIRRAIKRGIRHQGFRWEKV